MSISQQLDFVLCNSREDSLFLSEIAKKFGITDLRTLVCCRYAFDKNEKYCDIYKLKFLKQRSTIMFLRTIVGLERHFFDFFKDDGHLKAIYFKCTAKDREQYRRSMKNYWLCQTDAREKVYIFLGQIKRSTSFQSRVVSICEKIEFFGHFFL